jgi:RHH-type proline utilization regulon transcriptional repressor/proline dehydrogenase/delta 1-pyrroline-5-carboxylate dehydrogenase
VVGVQPFGGEGLSGTGPKAGGPLYLRRLVTAPSPQLRTAEPDPAAQSFATWLYDNGEPALAARCQAAIDHAPLNATAELPGPVGERNTYALHPLGRVLCVPATRAGALLQLGAALATGNHILLQSIADLDIIDRVPASIAARITHIADWRQAGPVHAVLFEGDSDRLRALNQALAAREGPITRVQGLSSQALAETDYRLEWLLLERAIATNVAAAGGNASLMTIG